MGERYIDAAYIYRAERLVGSTGSFTVWLATRSKEKRIFTVKPCTIFTEEGFIAKIESEGKELGRSRGKNGVNAQFHIATNVVKTGDETSGEIQRWVILDGRIRSIDSVAKDVLIEGMP